MSQTRFRVGSQLFAAMVLLGSLSSARAAEVAHLAPATDVLIGKSGNVLIVSGPEGALIVDDE